MSLGLLLAAFVVVWIPTMYFAGRSAFLFGYVRLCGRYVSPGGVRMSPGSALLPDVEDLSQLNFSDVPKTRSQKPPHPRMRRFSTQGLATGFFMIIMSPAVALKRHAHSARRSRDAPIRFQPYRSRYLGVPIRERPRLRPQGDDHQ
jgi:hypothetical protein